MQAHYLQLDCASSADHWLVSVESVTRDAIEPIRSADHFEEVERALAKQLLWQDFGQRGDWQDPAAGAAISSKQIRLGNETRSWEVGIFKTILADDVYVLARKSPYPPGGEALCLPTNNFLPANHFGSCLLHSQYGSSVRTICGRVLLVRLNDAESELAVGSVLHSFQSYTAKDFAADLQHVSKDILRDVSFQFPCDVGIGSIPGSHPLSQPPPEMLEATYVRMTCSDTGGRKSVVVEAYRRPAPICFATPCDHKQLRVQLARDMTWQDFGHYSDWGDPSSKSQISAKRGWEVGLLETTLGDGICILARKPPSHERWCIPLNHLATEMMDPWHKPYIQFVNGSVLLVRVHANLNVITRSSQGVYKLRSLDLASFHAAYEKLSAHIRDGISLTTVGVDGSQESTCKCTEPAAVVRTDGGSSDEMVETIVTPTLTALYAPDESDNLDGWELVSPAELVYTAAL